MDIFLSYGFQNADIAMRLSRALEDRGVRVWLDTLKLSRGEQAQAELEKLLAKADALVFLVGSEIQSDPKLESEWRSALRVRLRALGSLSEMAFLKDHTIRSRMRSSLGPGVNREDVVLCGSP